MEIEEVLASLKGVDVLGVPAAPLPGVLDGLTSLETGNESPEAPAECDGCSFGWLEIGAGSSLRRGDDERWGVMASGTRPGRVGAAAALLASRGRVEAGVSGGECTGDCLGDASFDPTTIDLLCGVFEPDGA